MEHLEKEAAPAGFFGRFLGRGANNTIGPNKNTGTMITNFKEQVPVDRSNVKMFTPEEVAEIKKQERIQGGVGGITTDITFGGVKLFSPQRVKEKLNDGLAKAKETIENVDTRLATPIAGTNAGSLRGKVFSVPTGYNGRGEIVGATLDDQGKVVDHLYRGAGGETRRPSLLAPVANTSRVAAPFLGAAFVADKMYGNELEEKEAQENVDYLTKIAETISTMEDKHGILKEENLALMMDKQASMQNIAYLEEELEKYAAEVDGLKEEVTLLTKQANWEREQKEQIHSDLKQSNQHLLEKKAEYEEFRLRTIARERSHSAVKLAEDMLSTGMIKQAEFNKQVDKLMECDEETFNLYTSLLKEARKDEDGVESLAFLVDYRSNDIDSVPTASERGMSKRGQSIGQAARDLIK